MQPESAQQRLQPTVGCLRDQLVRHGLAFGALPLIAVLVLHADPFEVSLLAAAGTPHGPEVPVCRPHRGLAFILADRLLRSLFPNTTVVNGLIMATEPLLAVLLLREFGLKHGSTAWPSTLPCLGGLLGSRLFTRPSHDTPAEFSASVASCASAGQWRSCLYGREHRDCSR